MKTMTLAHSAIAQFHLDGCFILRGLLSKAESETLFGELAEALNARGRRSEAPSLHWSPAMTSATPFARSMLGDYRFVGIAEQLLGRPVLGVGTDATVYSGDTPWHNDALACEGCETIKFGLYADRLTATNGALWVLPGSHRERPENIAATPVAIESEPGDAIVFDVRLWHASFGGRLRLTGSVNYRIDPATPEEVVRAQAYFATTHRRHRSLFEGELYPEEWRTLSTPYSRWMERMTELGILPSSVMRQ